MARRRLEEAIQAGQSIAKGKKYPDQFTGIKEEFTIKIEPELEGIYSLQYSFDGKLLAVGTGNGTIRIYDTTTGKRYPDVRLSRYGGLPVMCMRFHPKNPNILLAGTSAGTVLQADISDYFTGAVLHEQDIQESQTKQQKEQHQQQLLYHERFVERIAEKGGDFNQPNEIYCMDFDYTYSYFATAGRDLAIRIYSADTFQEITKYDGYSVKQNPNDLTSAGAAGRIFALKYHPKYDDILITGGWDDHLKVWDTRCPFEKGPVKRIIPVPPARGPHICGDSLDLREFEILTGSWRANDSLQTFNYTDGKETRSINFKSKDGPFLYCAQFCDNNTVLAGGSGTNSCQAIRVGQKTEPDEVIDEIHFEHPVQALDSTCGGRLFAVGDGNKSHKVEGSRSQQLTKASTLKLCRLV